MSNHSDQEDKLNRRGFLQHLAVGAGTVVFLGFSAKRVFSSDPSAGTPAVSPRTAGAVASTLLVSGPMEAKKSPVIGDAGRVEAKHVKFSADAAGGGVFELVCQAKDRNNLPTALRAKMMFLDENDIILLTQEQIYDIKTDQASLDQVQMRGYKAISTPFFSVQLDADIVQKVAKFQIELTEE
jgi:hypothetical protein